MFEDLIKCSTRVKAPGKYRPSPLSQSTAMPLHSTSHNLLYEGCTPLHSALVARDSQTWRIADPVFADSKFQIDLESDLACVPPFARWSMVLQMCKNRQAAGIRSTRQYTTWNGSGWMARGSPGFDVCCATPDF